MVADTEAELAKATVAPRVEPALLVHRQRVVGAGAHLADARGQQRLDPLRPQLIRLVAVAPRAGGPCFAPASAAAASPSPKIRSHVDVRYCVLTAL